MPYQRLADLPNGRLTGASAARIGRRSVKPVFNYVKVHVAQVHGAEVMEAVVDAMKLKAGIPLAHPLAHLRGAQKHVLVQRQHVFKPDRVLLRIKIKQIAKDKLEGVAELAVVLR